MSGDYLWDRSGAPDPEVVRLEQLLGTLREAGGPTRRPSMSFAGVVTSLAAGVVALIALSWQTPGGLAPGFEVTTLEGTPTIAAQPVADRRELRAGNWLETNDGARASIDIAKVGRVEVAPRTRISLVSTRPGNHRLHLARGTIHAFIWAPPGQFIVGTPSATAVDLGCAYTLTVDDRGVGHVRVTTGWVGFEWRGRESFIPAGAVCLTRPALGPGTPHLDDTSAQFQAALEALDVRLGTAESRRVALDLVLTESRAKDGFTLWHLLSRVELVEGAEPAKKNDRRGRVFDWLAQLAPPPSGVTRDGVLAGNREMLDDWWDTLGLGAANWWRVWKQEWRDGR